MTAQERVTAGIWVLRELWPCHDGPAHIVLADFNVRDGDLAWCIASIDRGEVYSDLDPLHPVFAATRAVLQYLLDETTEDERALWNEDPYDALAGYDRR